MLSLLSKINNREEFSHFNLVKDPDLNRVSDLLISRTKPVTLCNGLLTFGETDEKLKLQGDLLKMMINKTITWAKSQDRKILYDFAKENCFDEKTLGIKSTRDKSLIGLLKPRGMMVSASCVSSSHKKNLPQTEDFCHLILMNYLIDEK